MKSYILVKYYLIIWALYFLILVVLPVSYSGGEYYLSVLYLIGSVILSVMTFSILYMPYTNYRSKQRIYGISPPKYINFMMYISILFAVLSVVFLTYDRVFIQGIDFSRGIAFVRNELKNIAENRSGVSSVFSLFGNLLSGFPIVLSVLLYLYYDELKNKLRFLSLVTVVLTVGISTVLTGGRSVIMMFLASLLIIGLLRKFRGIGFVPNKISFVLLLCLICVIIVSLIYTVYVFSVRATAGGFSSYIYMLLTLNHLGGVFTGDGLNSIYFVNDVRNYLSITGAYLVHSAWTFQSILDLNIYDGSVTFNFYRVNIARIFDNSLDVGWEFSGLFSTYLGAFYYDYGFFGAVFSSIVLGVLIFISTLILYSRRLTPLHIGLFLSSMYIVILSPLLFAVDVMSFPFILFAFCILYLLSVFSRIRIFRSMSR